MTAAPPSDRELVLTRVIDAPRDKLYRAWTGPRCSSSGSRRSPTPRRSLSSTCARAAPTWS